MGTQGNIEFKITNTSSGDTITMGVFCTIRSKMEFSTFKENRCKSLTLGDSLICIKWIWVLGYAVLDDHSE
jgi:hypothetical protein